MPIEQSLWVKSDMSYIQFVLRVQIPLQTQSSKCISGPKSMRECTDKQNRYVRR